MSEFTLTGRHVALGMVGGFSIIVGVNIALAVSAVRTFPGLEVKNSYVASQKFDANRAAQEALEWDVSARVTGDQLVLRIDGKNGPVSPNIVQATLGRATHVKDDRELSFAFDGNFHRAEAADLAPGNWNLRLVAVAADGTEFRQRVIVEIEK